MTGRNSQRAAATALSGKLNISFKWHCFFVACYLQFVGIRTHTVQPAKQNMTTFPTIKFSIPKNQNDCKVQKCRLHVSWNSYRPNLHQFSAPESSGCDHMTSTGSTATAPLPYNNCFMNALNLHSKISPGKSYTPILNKPSRCLNPEAQLFVSQ
jgi:hypothetical protein